MLLPNSLALKIIDRRKNIFKLSQGEYVAPEKVEAVYTKSSLITEAFLHGDTTQHYPVCVVSIREGPIRELAKKVGVELENLNDICLNKNVRKAVAK